MTFDVKYDVLQGHSVHLEPINDSHVEGIFKAGQVYEDWAYLPIPGFQCCDEAAAWVAQAKQLAEQGVQYAYALVEPKTSEVIGSSRYMNVRIRDAVVEVGYTWLNASHQRSAVNTEAKVLLLGNAFEQMKANRVELKTDLRNLRSQRAIERIGGIKEGVLRNHMITPSGYVRDSVMYSIIESEWAEVKSNLLLMLNRKNG